MPEGATVAVDLKICRCVKGSHSTTPEGSVKLIENGDGAKPACKRDDDEDVILPDNFSPKAIDYFITNPEPYTGYKTPATAEDIVERSSVVAQRKWGVHRLYDVNRMFHTPTKSHSSVQGEELMKHAILDGGPIAAHIDVYDDIHHHKAGEVYSVSSSAKYSGGHAIMIYGWGTHTDGTPVWLCKNSWGKKWPIENNGEGDSEKPSGLFMVKRGDDVGQIESETTSWVYVHPGEKILNYEVTKKSPASPAILNYQKTKHFHTMNQETDKFSYNEKEGSLYGGMGPSDNLPWCPLPNMGLMKPEELKQSCLRITHNNNREIPETWIKNICSGAKVTAFKAQCTSTKSTCGFTKNTLEFDLRPFKKIVWPGYANCCIIKEWIKTVVD
jgi:hypothetical protein